MAVARLHELVHHGTTKPLPAGAGLAGAVREALAALDLLDLAAALAELHGAVSAGQLRLGMLLAQYTRDAVIHDELLGIEQVAALTGRSRSWIEHHPHALPGRLQARRGHKLYWSKRAVLAWVAALEHAA